MKHRLTGFAIALWTAILIVGAAGVAGAAFGIEMALNDAMQGVPLCQLMLILYAGAVAALYYFVLRETPGQPLRVILEALANALLLTQVFLVAANAISGKAGPHSVASSLLFIAYAAVFLFALFLSCMKFVKFSRRAFAFADADPCNQAALARIALGTDGPDIRLPVFEESSYSSPWAIPGEADLSGNEKAIASNSKESSACDSTTESVPEACNHDWILTSSGECTIGYCSYGGCDPTHSYTEYHCRYCGDMRRDCGGCPHDGFCNGD